MMGLISVAWLASLASAAIGIVSALDIDDFGAVPNVDNWEVASRNALALMDAVAAAAISETDREVFIPSDRVYFMANCSFYNLQDVTVVLDGIIRFSNKIQEYGDTGGRPFLYFEGVEGVRLRGTGTFDGQGLNWWRLAYVDIDNRPKTMEFQVSRDIEISDLLLLNSPSWSINVKDCADIIIHDVTIFIDSAVTRGRDDNVESVTYALNTDGIDIAAFNVTIYNTDITNYDDAIVPKPCRSSWRYCQCAGNIYAFNNTITYSTGLTIGSVPPNSDVNCVRNVTFKDTFMYRPLKAIYVKSNPGESGTGIIDDITFENIFISQALWWTVWIGPQQQNQPGGDSGTGCNFLFPKMTQCPTQPLVTISRITLRNVIAIDTVPLFEGPGVILCDPTNPCTDIVFDHVVNKMYTGNVSNIFDQLPLEVPRVVFPTKYRTDTWKFEYITTNAFGTIKGVVDPLPCLSEGCFWDGSSKN